MWKAHLGKGIPLSFITQLPIESQGRLTGMQNNFLIAPPLRERVGRKVIKGSRICRTMPAKIHGTVHNAHDFQNLSLEPK
jgi:hypothetical protein